MCYYYFEATSFIIKKVRELKALFSYFAVNDNYATAEEVLMMLRYMDIYSNESEINYYLYDKKISFPKFLIMYNDLNTAYLYKKLRQFHQKSEVELSLTSIDYFLIFNTSEDQFVELYKTYFDADFYNNILNDLDILNSLLNNQRILQIIYKFNKYNNFNS